MAETPFIARKGIQVANNTFIANTATSRVGINGAPTAVTLEVQSNDAVLIPTGNTGQRPSGANGYFRYNSESGAFEGYAAGAWGSIGGDVSAAGSNTYVQFNNSGAFGASSDVTYTTATRTFKVSGTVDTASANVRHQVVSDAANVVWNIANGQIATLTIGGNRNMDAPTNLKVGTYVLHVVQDGTGSRTLSWDSTFKWVGGAAPTLTTNASARDLFSFVCDGTNLYGSFLPDVK